MKIWGFCGSFCLFVQSNKGFFRSCKVIIGGKRSGGAKDARYFEGRGNKTSETQRGIFGGVFLEKSGFVGLIDDNEAKILDWREEGGTGTNDNLGMGRI